MKSLLPLKITAIATAIFTSTLPFSSNSLQAATIAEEKVDQTQVIAVAAPFGSKNYNLVVVEQIPAKQQCWSEMGSQPTIINPLWTTFDFTGSCRRATDSNGYSVHLDGQDTSQDYLLNLEEKDGELQLIAINFKDRSRTVVGKTFGMSPGKFLKIYLNPGWQFTKKTVDGKVVGHVFFSGDTQAIAAAGNTPPTAPPVATQPSFRDIAGDVYKEEIEQAVSLGFIAGFKEDNTFRPQTPLTREQLVSMVIEALKTVPDIKVQAPAQAPTPPYPDVMTSRWSAAKVQWAKDNQIVSGYPDGTFKPEKPVTRAELIAVLRRASEFVQVERGKAPNLTTTQAPINFTDITTHWGRTQIQEMSAYCKVASPLNETGNTFAPDTPSGRNYAAAATLRMQTCVTSGQASP
jgi:hypothetical protein